MEDLVRHTRNKRTHGPNAQAAQGRTREVGLGVQAEGVPSVPSGADGWGRR